MNESPTPQTSLPRWLAPAVVGLLSGQLALLWLQGMQLNRQHHDLAAIQEDVQSLAESLDQGSGPQDGGDGPGWAPARARAVRPKYARVRQEPKKAEGEQDPARDEGVKDLNASRDSAQKGVKDARDMQSKLSISENAKRAEEKAKIKEARAEWEKWAMIGAGVVIGALLLRGWLRARSE